MLNFAYESVTPTCVPVIVAKADDEKASVMHKEEEPQWVFLVVAS
jgi:hypothetical protein